MVLDVASGYEKANREIVPAVRYALIKALKTRYNKREEEIARELGMTQAAISKYLNGRLSEKVRAVERRIDRSTIDVCAKNIIEGNRDMVGVCICRVCNKLNDFGCSFSKAAPASATG